MTRGFDNYFIYLIYETKLCDYDKTCKSLDTEKSFLTLLGSGLKIKPYINQRSYSRG